MVVGGALGRRNFPVSCERVALSRIEGSGKASLVWRKGMGVERERAGWGGGGWESKVSAGSTPDPGFWGQMLGKMPLTKKANEKISHPRAEFNGRLKLPGWLGKDGAAQTLGQAWLL
jgi:hypothetical protein